MNREKIDEKYFYTRARRKERKYPFNVYNIVTKLNWIYRSWSEIVTLKFESVEYFIQNCVGVCFYVCHIKFHFDLKVYNNLFLLNVIKYFSIHHDADITTVNFPTLRTRFVTRIEIYSWLRIKITIREYWKLRSIRECIL